MKSRFISSVNRTITIYQCVIHGSLWIVTVDVQNCVHCSIKDDVNTRPNYREVDCLFVP